MRSFNMPLSVQVRAHRQKVKKDLKDPNNIINKGDPDTSQTWYTNNKEHAFLSTPDRTLTKLTID